MLGGDCQLGPLRERGCHDRVEAFVYVCIYMLAVVLRGPAALPVLPDPTDPVEPIQPHGISRGSHPAARLPPADRLRGVKLAPFSIPPLGALVNPELASLPQKSPVSGSS
jgi:hypothetical protein